MEGHREISRAGGESTTEQLAAEIVGAGLRAAEFVGYETTDVLTAVVAVGPRARHAAARRSSSDSPFYAAGGGQVSDAGYLELDGSERAARGRRGAQVRRRPGALRRDRRRGASQPGDARCARSSTGARASRRWRTTPPPTCCTRRSARCSATTSSRPARRCAPTSSASTSATRSRSAPRSASGSSGSSTRRSSRRSPCARS